MDHNNPVFSPLNDKSVAKLESVWDFPFPSSSDDNSLAQAALNMNVYSPSSCFKYRRATSQ